MSSFSDQYDDAGGKYLTEGWHEVRARSYNLSYGQIHGTPILEVYFEDQDGRTGRKRFFATDKAIKALTGFCRVCGMSKEEMTTYDPVANVDDFSRLGDWLIGKPLRVRVEPEQGQKGKTYNNITWPDKSQKPIPELKARPAVSDEPPECEPPKYQEHPAGGADCPF